MHATLLANNFQHFWISQCASVCTPCCRLFRVVGSRCAKFETSQTFKPTTPQHSYFFCDRWSIVQQCWIHLHSLEIQHCWGNTCAWHMVSKVLWAISFPWCTADPNIVGSCCIHLHYVGSCCVGSCLHLAEHTTPSNTFLAFCPEHCKTSKWVLKLQFLTLRQDHKDPFTFMSETPLNPPAPPPPQPKTFKPQISPDGRK